MTKDTSPRLTVLHTLKAPGRDTTYATHMLESAPEELEVRFFSWKAALNTRYDVLHLHWPEYLVRGRGRKDMIRSLYRMPSLLLKIRRENIAVVRTLHNHAPHERGYWFENYFLRLLDRHVVKYISLNSVDASRDVEMILHGDYIEKFAKFPRADKSRGRLLYFGLVRPYKGIDRLVEVFDELGGRDLDLRVVGRPNSPVMMSMVLDAVASRAGRMSARLEFVSDADLVVEVSAAELVILPYREMQNSGSLLVALSLGTPVLTIHSPVNRSIQNEVGEDWVWLYDGDLTADVVDRTIAAIRGLPLARTPKFLSRDWETVGAKHFQLYRSAVIIATDGT